MLGKVLLRLNKAGAWVFGPNSTPAGGDLRLIVNPASLSSGYVAWYMAKIEGEKMQPLSAGPIDPSTLGAVKSGTPPPGKTVPSGRGWEQQVSVDLVTDEKVPLQLIYKTSSRGGVSVLLELAGAIAFGLQEDPRRVYPVVTLGVDSYEHGEYGTVYTPMLDIVEWLDAKGAKVEKRRALV